MPFYGPLKKSNFPITNIVWNVKIIPTLCNIYDDSPSNDVIHRMEFKTC